MQLAHKDDKRGWRILKDGKHHKIERYAYLVNSMLDESGRFLADRNKAEAQLSELVSQIEILKHQVATQDHTIGVLLKELQSKKK